VDHKPELSRERTAIAGKRHEIVTCFMDLGNCPELTLGNFAWMAVFGRSMAAFKQLMHEKLNCRALFTCCGGIYPFDLKIDALEIKPVHIFLKFLSTAFPWNRLSCLAQKHRQPMP
jgi:hypothetical protein